MKHAEVIKFLQDEIRSLDQLSTPNRNTVTQLYADENIAMAVKLHSAIYALESVEALTAERDSAVQAAKYAEHIDATPENQLQTMLYDTLKERDALRAEIDKRKKQEPSTPMMFKISKARDVYRGYMDVQKAFDYLEALIASRSAS